MPPRSESGFAVIGKATTLSDYQHKTLYLVSQSLSIVYLSIPESSERIVCTEDRRSPTKPKPRAARKGWGGERKSLGGLADCLAGDPSLPIADDFGPGGAPRSGPWDVSI
ncbi:hypothetical protein CDAR_386461 [Caerostris darwini]|uniref:Uncharacterized protein n=1 Tax=Caerostris darwini TaxID=1538125 RepID=A0AAV4QDX5_9ARAC|nr:hypothetical protein CDAR_386461 [Caerostris darwini]